MALLTFPRDSAMYVRIEQAFDSKSQTELAAWLDRMVRATSKPARNELAILNTIAAIVSQRGGGARGIPSLGQTILVQQMHKLERYGDTTYRLSGRQIEVILGEIHRHSAYVTRLFPTAGDA